MRSCSGTLKLALPVPFFLQKYTEEMLSAEPSQPPPPPLQHFLEQPVERVQQYQALLKVCARDSRWESVIRQMADLPTSPRI